MDLLKSINANIKASDAEISELKEFVAEMEKLEAKNIFKLTEIFGGESRKEKKRRQEARARAVQKGNSARGAGNSVRDWDGGMNGKLSPTATAETTPEKKPKPELDNTVGPEVGNIIRKNGVLYQVISSENLNSIAKDKQGRKIKIDWATLKAPVTKGGITLYDVG